MKDCRFCQFWKDKSFIDGWHFIAKMKENTTSVTRKNEFLRGCYGDLYVKEFRQDCTFPFREKKRVNTRDKR